MTRLHPNVQAHLHYNVLGRNLKIGTQMQLVSTRLLLIVQGQLQGRNGTQHILRMFRVAGCSDCSQLRSQCEF